MPLYMYQFAYTPESWAAQLKKPENRIESVGRASCEAAGGKFFEIASKGVARTSSINLLEIEPTDWATTIRRLAKFKLAEPCPLL